MGSVQFFVVLVTLSFLMIFTGYASAIKCYMCNSRMGESPRYSDCTNNANYHPMNCSGNAVRCLKLVGNHASVNRTQNMATNITRGTLRDCGTPANLAAYFPTGVPKDGCYANQAAINRTIEGNTNVTFTGTICLCSKDNCNAAYRTELSSLFLLFLTVVAVYGSN